MSMSDLLLIDSIFFTPRVFKAFSSFFPSTITTNSDNSSIIRRSVSSLTGSFFRIIYHIQIGFLFEHTVMEGYIQGGFWGKSV